MIKYQKRPIKKPSLFCEGFVRVEGLEPPCLAALDPKSSVSTNFTTPALFLKGNAKVNAFYLSSKNSCIILEIN